MDAGSRSRHAQNKPMAPTPTSPPWRAAPFTGAIWRTFNEPRFLTAETEVDHQGEPGRGDRPRHAEPEADG